MPAEASLSAQHAAIDAELRARHEAGLLAGQKQHHVGDVVALGIPAQGNGAGDGLLRRPGALLQILGGCAVIGLMERFISRDAQR